MTSSSLGHVPASHAFRLRVRPFNVIRRALNQRLHAHKLYSSSRCYPQKNHRVRVHLLFLLRYGQEMPHMSPKAANKNTSTTTSAERNSRRSVHDAFRVIFAACTVLSTLRHVRSAGIHHLRRLPSPHSILPATIIKQPFHRHHKNTPHDSKAFSRKQKHQKNSRNNNISSRGKWNCMSPCARTSMSLLNNSTLSQSSTSDSEGFRIFQHSQNGGAV